MQTKQKRSIKGRISKVTKHRVHGWAFRENSEVIPTLRLVVNGKQVQTCQADIFREPLKKVHPTGTCGFSFVLKKKQALSDEDVVQVFCGQQEIEHKIKPPFDEYYFFIHIPKTAGSSFRSMLYKQFDQEVIYPNLNDIEETGGYYPTYQTITEAAQRKNRPFQFLMGHYPYPAGKLLPKSPRYIVFLRDPVKRVISHLYHLKRHGTEQFRKASLHEILEMAGWQMNNLQVRYISDKHFQANKIYLENTELGENALLQAQKNIDRCDFVGITEHFDESVKKLHNTFGWDLGKTIKTNVAPRRHRKVPKDIYQYILEHNQLDIRLYEYAKNKYYDNL